jgi:hypothetical protein
MLIKIDEPINRIKIYLFAVAGMNRNQIAEAAGLSEGATRGMHDPAWNPTLETLRKLEALVPDDFAFAETPKLYKSLHLTTQQKDALKCQTTKNQKALPVKKQTKPLQKARRKR